MAALLGGCSGTVQENLGIGKHSPDEFQVVRRAPLVLPPDYSLRPPAPARRRRRSRTLPARPSRSLRARSARRPAPIPTRAGRAGAGGAGPVQAEPGIRQLLVAEDAELVSLDASRFLFILNFQRKAMQAQPNVLDPVAEAQALAVRLGRGQRDHRATGSQPIAQ